MLIAKAEGEVNEEEKLKKVLLRKATGYSAKEETVEYSRDKNGKEIVLKRKVSKKHYPPDVSALKLLIEQFYNDKFEDLSSLTDEELEEERQKIIELLKEDERKNADKKDW